ncbi:MAG: efflux RND transporter permease subunit [Gemmatimonadaceae bacterium]
MARSIGISGRIAQSFLHSKLTPLIIIASLAMGVLGIVATPREEEPQISVPMVDVVAAMPGASPSEAENLLARPIEQRMMELAGVDHVYTMSGDGYAMVTVRFKVGEDQERSIIKVQAKLAGAMDQAPAGALPPVIKAHSIDDVPVLTLTLHAPGANADANMLRQVALHLEDEIRTVPDVSETFVTGGVPKQIRVVLDPARLAASGVSVGEVMQALRGANARLAAGDLTVRDSVVRIDVGAPLSTAGEVASVVVATRNGASVYVGNVADVREDFGETTSYVSHREGTGVAEPAVTIAVAKRKGANATVVTRAVLDRVEQAKGRLVPSSMLVSVTRDYGETAGEKARELILHLLIATLSVTVLIWLFLGWREAVVVLVAVPVTLALTLFAYYALGYTLNRITLFALIFSIGILVDDAIVVVENMYRHMSRGDLSPEVASVEAVDEVGNPTILATFAVIAAILPMAFVSGMMGPYMRPIPIGASVAMLASLAVAFTVTPYLAYRLLKGHVASPHTSVKHPAEEGGRVDRLYRRIMLPLMQQRGRRRAFYGVILLMLVGSMSLVALKAVQVKMLPFDNKSEFQVVLDLPEGATLETSNRAASEIAEYLSTIPEVVSSQVYAGTAAPFNFNGLVRHYFLRAGANVADVQVNLLPKEKRSRHSHTIAVMVRPAIDSIARKYAASAKVAEIPPGPPVLSTLVAEVYASNDSSRLAAARAVRSVFEHTPGVVDIDWTVEAPQSKRIFRVDRVRAAEAGASVEQITQTLYLALSGASAGIASVPSAREGVAIVTRLPVEKRSSVSDLLALPVATRSAPQPLANFVTVAEGVRESSRVRKDLRPAIYVTGDVAREIESPVYAILAMNRQLDSIRVDGAAIGRYNAVAPASLSETAIKWDGEWQVTIEVFRDLGLAFAVVLLLIYVLVVGWFKSFTVPLVIMAPIPLTLIGILPAHAASGAFFTATSMIGMIALAGIIVRNSILLVDFIQLEQSRGRSVTDAVLEAGAVRFRPIALTAAAVVVGGIVMVLDPIFQGLAVALMSGAIVATALTMVVVPLLYWQLKTRGVYVS